MMMTKGSGNPQSFAIEWNKRGACFKAMAAVGLVQSDIYGMVWEDTLSSSRGDNPARPSIRTACDPATDLTSQNDPQMMHVDYELACVGELGIQDA